MSEAVEREARAVPASAPIRCWSCSGPTRAAEPFCDTCGAVQPPGQIDSFHLLGLEIGFDVDAKALEKAYFARQRQLHPDRFATKSGREKAIAGQMAASLNEAYDTLKDPLRRSLYMLRLSGREVANEDGATISDPELLMKAMETREALMEAEDEAAIAAIEADAAAERETLIQRLSAAFGEARLDDAERAALELKYLVKLGDEIRTHRRRLKGS